MFKITEIPCNFPLNVNFSSQFPCEIYFLAFSLQELVFPCGKEKSLQVEALYTICSYVLLLIYIKCSVFKIIN